MGAPKLEATYGDNIFELQLKMDAEHPSSVVTKYTGFFTTSGTTLAMTNTMITVKGVGNRFNEDLFISGVEHVVSAGNWITKFQIGIPAGV